MANSDGCSASPSLLQSAGLFGGLLTELGLSRDGLLKEINDRWSVQDVVDIEDVSNWSRGGAETYISVGRLIFASDRSSKVLGKAFVKWSATLPQQQQTTWEFRRKLLREAGIPVPEVYAQYPGLSVEEFIPHAMPEPNKINLTQSIQLGLIARSLVELELRPLAILNDIRCRGDTLYYVDFGEDLTTAENTGSITWVADLKSNLSTELRLAFEQGFELVRMRDC